MIELVSALSAAELFAALAHESRLQAFRLLVRAGSDGLCAGQLARRLGLSPTAASFHFNRMRQAGLVQRRRSGAQIFYVAQFSLMRKLRDFLDQQCCADDPAGCTPQCARQEAMEVSDDSEQAFPD